MGGTVSISDINEDADWTKVSRKTHTRVERFGKVNSVLLVVSELNKSVKGLQIAQFFANKNIDIDGWALLTKREDATFLTFKIAVKPQDVDKIMEVKDWPDVGTQVRTYKPPRNNITKNNRNQMRQRSNGGQSNNHRNNNNESEFVDNYASQLLRYPENNGMYHKNNNIQYQPMENNMAPQTRYQQENGMLWNSYGNDGFITGNSSNTVSPIHGIQAPLTPQVQSYQSLNGHSTLHNLAGNVFPSSLRKSSYGHESANIVGRSPTNSLYIPTATAPKMVRFLDRTAANTFTEQY